MNWRFTRPGCAVFEEDEPLCCITLVEYRALDEATPENVPMNEAPELVAQFKSYKRARVSMLLSRRTILLPSSRVGKNRICGERARSGQRHHQLRRRRLDHQLPHLDYQSNLPLSSVARHK